MTIEATLERIADALEILAGSRQPDNAPPVETKAQTAAEKKAEKAALAAAKKKDKADPEPEAEATIDAVRTALKDLQKATDAATAKGILGDFDVSTLSELDNTQYSAVITAANAAAEAA